MHELMFVYELRERLVVCLSAIIGLGISFFISSVAIGLRDGVISSILRDAKKKDGRHGAMDEDSKNQDDHGMHFSRMDTGSGAFLRCWVWRCHSVAVFATVPAHCRHSNPVILTLYRNEIAVP